ncbi:MAG: S8 family serine peptidase, partial [Actinocrinis sp.]
VVQNGQRYLDYPSLPLIPTYTADDNGALDPLGSTEGQDPNLGEILLDFSMMSPLPHDRQRAANPGSGATDLLGIAPGAKYRLVVPRQQTEQDLAESFLAAANQTPRPNVITASIGWGADSIGYAGRYLEDDPLMHTILDHIVSMGIAVVISSNDGTREGLPVAIGPDGGSVPTDVTGPHGATTSFENDQATTQPTVVADSGAVVAGASTLDDTLAASGATAQYPTTRYDGFADYSSGFGTRVDLAAPGDNLPSLIHVCDYSADPGCTKTDTEVTLNGGTSASAPMIAAAMADVLQAAKATGRELSPAQLRDLLVKTGRPLAQTPQTDQTLRMGPELDVTKAVESVLGAKYHLTGAAVRLSVAQRRELGQLGAEFEEDTNPAAIDLTSQDAVNPITFGLDLTGLSGHGLTYRLRVGAHGVIAADGPSVRVTPAQFFAAAGQPLAATASRTVPVTFEALRAGRVVASAGQSLTFSATDGTYPEALAPTAPGSAPLGRPVTVHYDLTGVQNVDQPVLELSSVGHWTPNGGGDIYRAAYSVPLTE